MQALAGWSAFLAVWLAVGLVIGILLERQGHPREVAVLSLAFWPMTLSRFGAVRSGPMAERIDRALARLGEVFGPSGPDLDAVRRALHRIDGRLARVDRILAEEADLPESELRALRQARDAAAAGIASVLDDLARLRVRAGLAALESDSGPVAARLAEIGARIDALDEVGGMLAGDG